MERKPVHVSYLTQVPGPYRERMHELVSEFGDFSYDVIYCAKVEPNRKWKLSYGDYPMYFLAEKAETFRHNNLNVWGLLNKLNPTILIITAFKPTMLYGVLWCLLRGRKIIVYNDGTYDSEQHLSFTQKLIRKLVYKVTSAFMAPGKGTVDLYKSYGVAEKKIFKSCLCVDNTQFEYQPMQQRPYHILYCGQITERKLPFLFTDVAIKLNKEIPNFKALIVGDGALKDEMLLRLDKNNVDYHFAGFLDQKSLLSYYAKAKVFLFTTIDDVWGIVANEACASGTPVITSKEAGVAGDLILDGENGYVLPLDANVWANTIKALLENEQQLETFAEKAMEIVKPFNHQQAADGLRQAVNWTQPAKKNQTTLTPLNL
ncbi:glycosyltransferase family 4 protein [Pedobacter endophyticus]|uniref:Glycosyltransferase family 4 protein n=1 Tax=Pedobacter endophyticus TaxID=2789740 RepID=A0A7S9PZ23_9SPHI|nr:glycosyltransferase family 4 protein [Pedobacter endophyticus]QPH39938.1 glycosyltransferase family 4 protein [Pedobacter endophyticus]